MSISLPEDEGLRILLSTNVIPFVLWPMIHVNIFQDFVSVDDILWFQIFARIYGLEVAQCQRVVVQRASQGLPETDVLAPTT